MAVTVQADKQQNTIYYSAWQLLYRRTCHKSQYDRAHASYGTGGQNTDHNIIQHMAVTVQADMPQITI